MFDTPNVDNANASDSDSIPNAKTQAAIAELEAGGGARFTTVQALMADLNSDDD